MSAYYVNWNVIKEANYDLPYVEMKADYAKRRTYNIKKEIPDRISNTYQIGERIDDVCKEIEKLKRQISKLYEVTNSCMEQYAYTEHMNSENVKLFDWVNKYE